MGTPTVVELRDLPEPEHNTAVGRLLFAEGTTVLIMYQAARENDEWAVVRVDGCTRWSSDGPNDEAFHNHPLYELVKPNLYQLQEIVDSPILLERARTNDKDMNSARSLSRDSKRHFLFAFKENTCEFIARSCTAVGVYATYQDAELAALEQIGLRRVEPAPG